MLAQLLNRDFMLGVARASEHQSRSIVANRAAGLVTDPPTELDAISTDELRKVADTLAEIANRKAAEPEGGPPLQVGGEPPPAKDDYHTFHRESLLGPRFGAQGGSSMFAIANDRWQLLGLETAYEDGGLCGEQTNWIRRMRCEHPERKTHVRYVDEDAHVHWCTDLP